MSTQTPIITDALGAVWDAVQDKIADAREHVLYQAKDGEDIQLYLAGTGIWSEWNAWAPWIRDTRLSHDLYHAIYEQHPDAAWADRYWIDGMLAAIDTWIDGFRDAARWAWQVNEETT